MEKSLSLLKLRRYFLLIGIIPILMIATFEILSVSESENEIQALMNQQIDMILYSVNQQSWEIVNEWFDSEHGVSPILRAKENSQLEIPSVLMNAQVDLQSGNVRSKSGLKVVETPSFTKVQDFDWTENRELMNSGYRKIEVFWEDSTQNEMVFAGIASSESEHIIHTFLVDKRAFIENQLFPVLDLASKSGFTLEVIQSDKPNSPIISTGKEKTGNSYEKPLWLFPDYRLRLTSQFHSLEESIRMRRIRSVGLISLLFLILAGGLFGIYSSVKKQIELSALKSDFVANVSHELRTPLSLIRMFAESLELGRVKSEAKKTEYFRTIRMETERLSHLINNILNFSKMEAGTKSYSMTSVQVNDILAEIMETYAFKLEQEGFTSQFHPQKNLPVILGDSDSLREAFLNLIDNAMKYSAEKKEISVATSCEMGLVSVRISDKGIGIKKDDQRKIFDKFFRVSGTLVHESKGAGLGLNLVSHIINAHNGQISVESAPGVGSTFTILIPMFENNA